jgi:SnoaL-like domain
MAVRPELSAPEAADRLAIRELFDAYAHRADRRDAEGQKALFTVDTRFAVYIDGEGSEASHVLEGRDALAPVFADLNRYEATTHFNGQSTVEIDKNRATGESYTIAHHVYTDDSRRKIMILQGEPGDGKNMDRRSCSPAGRRSAEAMTDE